MLCPVCGKENTPDRRFCCGCGNRLVSAAPVNNQPVYTAPAQTNIYIPQPTIPEEYKPIGAWMYLVWSLVFGIPLVGFILQIVFACGGTKNINLRNYARSYLCALLIAVIIVFLVFIMLTLFGFSLAAVIGTAASVA